MLLLNLPFQKQKCKQNPFYKLYREKILKKQKKKNDNDLSKDIRLFQGVKKKKDNWVIVWNEKKNI